MNQKMKKGILWSVTLGLGLFSARGIYALGHDMELWHAAVRQEHLYIKSYVKKDPTMAPVINRYFDCKLNKVTAIEGCFDYSVKSKQEGEKLVALQNYLSSEVEKTKAKAIFMN